MNYTLVMKALKLSIQQLTSRQREVLKLMNPLEYGFNQYETSVLMGLSERQVSRIIHQLKVRFPEAMEIFDKLKKDTNRLGRRLKKPLLIKPSLLDNGHLLCNSKIVRIWR